MNKKPLILITNDDGVKSSGIRALINYIRPYGKVVVVAPDRPQSGTAHAVTIAHPLRLDLITKEKDYEEYCCNGTPADCVKLAFKIVMKRRPDFLFSGINHGTNASINIVYSGTMAAVLEGALAGVPSVGFSLSNYSLNADFKPSEKIVQTIVGKVIEHGLPSGICLNVNIPDISYKSIRGIKVCRQSEGTWQEDFDEREDPNGRKYYWMKGVFVNIGNGQDTDQWALDNNYVSVVPVQLDLTAPIVILKSIKSWF
ncbi:MAG: 5'/3'-nucleotidase SurE [Bacteroidales bacterium]|nr:5'/3'-nucleotidase SurE [Bacteroidales bacterium]MDD4602848.1 5'/3'-nucleotidase SurE [Bacteroidales bacterium]